MQFNVFDWIREGVKRSVILGVHDAVEAIGSPAGDDVRTRLAAALAGPAEAADGPAWPPAASASASAARSATSTAAEE